MELLQKLNMRKSGTAKKAERWGLFLCDYCGEKVEREFARGVKQISCNCLKVKHGCSRGEDKGFRLYRVWVGMCARCYYLKDPQYHNYGGRGIRVCDEWRFDPESFMAWARANGYEKGLEIDRKENNDNYEPSNCRFVTSAVNARNRRTTKLTSEAVQEIRALYSKGGITQKQLGIRFGVAPQTIHAVTSGQNWRAF